MLGQLKPQWGTVCTIPPYSVQNRPGDITVPTSQKAEGTTITLRNSLKLPLPTEGPAGVPPLPRASHPCFISFRAFINILHTYFIYVVDYLLNVNFTRADFFVYFGIRYPQDFVTLSDWKMDEWIDGRMADGWVDGWVGGCMGDGWVGWQIHGSMDRQKDGQEDAREDGADSKLERRKGVDPPSPLPQRAQHRDHGLLV